jgi:F0F1-type ATP synthase delta subunit
MFKDKVYTIMKEFKTLTKNHNKSRLLQNRMSKKLESSLEQYHENLEETINYLASRNSVTILKGIIKKFGKEGKNND